MKISRSKIDLFCRCQRCFWLDVIKGIKAPSCPAFTLNTAVDQLLKNEMDHYRSKGIVPPIAMENNLDLVPFQHPNLSEWRQNFKGIRHIHLATGMEIYGAVDDLWADRNGLIHVVDYKATSKKDDPSLEGGWGPAYKRQAEIYQWLLRQNGLPVSNTGFFVYANGIKGENHFENVLKFKTTLISHQGSADWVEGTLKNIRECVDSTRIPDANPECEQCTYNQKVLKILGSG